MWVKSVTSRFLPFCFACIFTFGTIASHSASLCAQSTSNPRNGSARNDEKRENKRVSDAKREVGRTRTELEKLQTDWEKKYRAFVTARGNFLKLKSREEQVEKEAQERIGEKLGLPAHVLVVKELGKRLRETSEAILQEVRKTPAWEETQERIEQTENALELGIHPDRKLPMNADDIEEVEKELRKQRNSLRAIEQAALVTDADTKKMKEEFDDAQRKLVELRSKVDPKQLDRDFAVKKIRSEVEQAYKTMRSEAQALERSQGLVNKKATELGSDYQSYLKAKRADAADSNRSKKKSPQRR